MRHHFGDLLDRDGGYWTVIPNREHYAHRIGDVLAGSPEITIVTIGKDDANWSDAVEAWAWAVECRRHVVSLPQLQGPHVLAALTRALLRLGPALRETGKVTEAARTLAEGLTIWRELGLCGAGRLIAGSRPDQPDPNS